MNTFAAKYDAKYPQAVACLTKDRDALLAFYDFPAEHWRHIRTTNPNRKRLRYPSATAPCAPRAACLTGQLWPWSSS